MKAEELMIGDWVIVYEKAMPVKAMVDGVYGNNAFVLGHQRTVENGFVEPIRLTPEILEKNGFKYDGSGQRSMMLMTPHGESGTRWNIYVGLKHKTIDVFSAPPVEKSPGWRKHNKVYLEVCGCYVHELQHALRMCGIDKTIEL